MSTGALTDTRFATSSNAGRFRDTVPHIRAAGKLMTDPDDGVRSCLTQDHLSRISTPPNMQPFRRSFREQPGKATGHYGKAFDAPPPDIRFGYKNDTSVTAETLINPPPQSIFSEKRQQLREAVRGVSTFLRAS